MRNQVRFAPVIALLACAGAASAQGTINASYGVPNGYLQENFSLFGNGLTENASLIQGHRNDLPGPGVDGFVPTDFPSYCVELNEVVYVGVLPGYGPDTQHHVFPLLGSTTNNGGVFFDPVRTDRMERLWGAFQSTLASNGDHAAFQLAVWEITFDNDMDLLNNAGTMNMFGGVNAETLQAQGFLDAIVGGAGPSQDLVILSELGNQDLITTPAPGSVALLSLGGLVLTRRRRA